MGVREKERKGFLGLGLNLQSYVLTFSDTIMYWF